ncbi:MAG TPA: ABC transporter permease [Planctomycetota bacterium]|nr:ABC transporter permease [Planctomycetota bacterium]
MSELTSRIGTQVKLPASVAFEVVMQGIRIRLGRSIVTMMGIVLGIAFLMAVLSGEVIRGGVSDEEQLRATVRRMANFLAAEVGPPEGRRFAVLLAGKPSAAEIRLLRQLRDKRAEAVRLAPAAAGVSEPDELRGVVQLVSTDDLADGAHALLVIGGERPEMDWAAVLERARNKVVAFSRGEKPDEIDGVIAVALGKEPGEHEQEKLARDAHKRAFRRGWVVVISLIASVICISNAMLMSVTERFREIGTMKCLGALSAFIRQMFLIESTLMGVAGSLLGALTGLAFALIAYGFTYGFGLVFGSLEMGSILLYAAICLAVGVVLSAVAALYPARIASRMLPANALRTNV